MEKWMRVLREAVQALLAVSLTGGVLYFTAIGILDPAIMVGLATGATAYYFAERKNGEERTHIEAMYRRDHQWPMDTP